MGLHRYTARSFGRELVMIAVAIGSVSRFTFLRRCRSRPRAKSYLSPLAFPTSAQLDNYSESWNQGVGNGLLSSAIITVSSVVVIICVGSICAYAIARRPI